ncbi:MAG TPA: DUF6766 family protein [Gemmatimonadales bacterium]|nr:DUF6766 family protein [Gemmatimonadales bacterium]
MPARRSFFRDNGLSMVLLALFLASFAGQVVAGYRRYNEEQREHGQPPRTVSGYLSTPAFLEATMENWESEFLQMAMYVLLTALLFQRGSSESKDPDKPEPVDRRPDPSRPGAPWPVRRGGLALTLYQHSLALAFTSLFVLSFALHAAGGAGEYNEEQEEHGRSERVTTAQYMGSSRFWFESFQNWQSEFLSMAAMVVLTIFLRQRGSPESKPVDAAHSETGE